MFEGKIINKDLLEDEPINGRSKYVRLISPNKVPEKLGFGSQESRNLEFKVDKIRVNGGDQKYESRLSR